MGNVVSAFRRTTGPAKAGHYVLWLALVVLAASIAANSIATAAEPTLLDPA